MKPTQRKFIYVLHPGFLTGRTDGQTHFISFTQLATCYRLNYGECFTSEHRTHEYFWYIHLTPRPLGDYIEWKEKCLEMRKELIMEVDGKDPTILFKRWYVTSA